MGDSQAHTTDQTCPFCLAFPDTDRNWLPEHIPRCHERAALRDRFATAAMPIVRIETTGKPSHERVAAEIARLSYVLADAMLAARGGR